MSYIAAAQILTRIREVLEDSVGTLRTVPTNRFKGDAPEGLSEDALRIRAASFARTEASIVAMRPSPSTPPIIGNVLIDEIDVQVKIARTIEPISQIDDDTRVALQALALTDADVVRQALGFPGNLSTTTAGTATDLVSGLLRYISTNEIVIGAVDDGAQTLSSIHLLRGLAISRPAIT